MNDCGKNDLYYASERDRSGDVCGGRGVARGRRPPGMLRPGAAGDEGRPDDPFKE